MCAALRRADDGAPLTALRDAGCEMFPGIVAMSVVSTAIGRPTIATLAVRVFGRPE
jgi:hypothetical protein